MPSFYCRCEDMSASRVPASLARDTVEELTGRIRVAGMSRRLVDQVQEDPPQVETVAEATRLGERKVPHRLLCLLRPVAISGGRVRRGEVGGTELRFAPTDVGAAEAAVDPPPLDVSEVIHDAHDRYQAAIRSPSRLFVVESVEFPQDGTPEVAKPSEQQLTLVRVAWRNAHHIVGRHGREVTEAAPHRRAHSQPWVIAVILAPVTLAPEVTAAPDSTRDRLVDAATEVFCERGYDKAGVQEIARRAGLTTGAIYANFSGKAELLVAALRHSARGVLEERLAAGDGAVGTDLFREVGRSLVESRPAVRRELLLEAFVAARRNPEVADVMRTHLQVNARRLGHVVEAGRTRGEVADTIDADAVVRFATALSLGFLFFDALDLPHPDREGWADLIDRVVAALADPPAVPTPTTN